MSGTLVFQSHSKAALSTWHTACLRSVRAWANKWGHEYRFLDDSLFDPLPDWFLERCVRGSLPATDFARLLWCKWFLDNGWDHVIWLDADILILAPEIFSIEDEGSHILCRELWIWVDRAELKGHWRVNNCVMGFSRGNDFLSEYMARCEELIRANAGAIDRLALGPSLLTQIAGERPLRALSTVATLSPTMLLAIRQRNQAVLRAFKREWRAPVHAVHLCGSLVGRGGSPCLSADDDLTEVVALLDKQRSL